MADKRQFWFLWIYIFWSAQAWAEEQIIDFPTYHDVPPFVVDADAGIGLTHELAAMLSRHSDGRYLFKPTVVPRKRLDLMLDQEMPLVVPWVNPQWFPNMPREVAFWTGGFMTDNNAILSPATLPVEYEGPVSLAGKSVASVLGHRLVGIDVMVSGGKIERLDVSSFWSAMKMVAVGRANVAIVPMSVAKYYIVRRDLAGVYHFSIKPHSAYRRHFLVTRDEALKIFIQEQVARLREDPVWKSIMAGYGL
ncbi:hypothetical protein [Aestuariispira insulae]|uniref:Amino acid ABC transporter substrate-binding protein (PAAT family) n=1 Tax=Aestuariispira insulae TaxID=1461337 RepID=A0A3D9HE47_9PROT|nr:hypothetical protein [Aestuariispira insulae]RED47735.1 amino acid ABC transporter substrate-binding protein (PAAT family) [Aestuariispira insulae]